MERTSENNTIQQNSFIRQQPSHGWLLHASSGVSYTLLHLSVLKSQLPLVRDKNVSARGSRRSQPHNTYNHEQAMVSKSRPDTGQGEGDWKSYAISGVDT